MIPNNYVLAVNKLLDKKWILDSKKDFYAGVNWACLTTAEFISKLLEEYDDEIYKEYKEIHNKQVKEWEEQNKTCSYKYYAKTDYTEWEIRSFYEIEKIIGEGNKELTKYLFSSRKERLNSLIDWLKDTLRNEDNKQTDVICLENVIDSNILNFEELDNILEEQQEDKELINLIDKIYGIKLPEKYVYIVFEFLKEEYLNESPELIVFKNDLIKSLKDKKFDISYFIGWVIRLFEKEMDLIKKTKKAYKKEIKKVKKEKEDIKYLIKQLKGFINK